MANRSKHSVKKKVRSSSSKAKRTVKKVQPGWARLPNEELLECRLCDLDLSLEGTQVERCLDRLHREIKNCGLRLKPHYWISDDWFSPDGIPGIAVPFYMAHPRLRRLERNQMMEVEGGTQTSCMQILRHEAGHAFDTAYRLHRRKKYRELFGKYSTPYPETYKPDPNSKSYVNHLKPWYAQSHPSEDFAETFAVWLKPRSMWRRDYAGWKAIRKLEYVDELMSELKSRPPKFKSRAKVDPVNRLKQTLREHYAERLACYDLSWHEALDSELKKLFPQIAKSRRSEPASNFLQKNRKELTRLVAQWTGECHYNVDQVVREMIARCCEQKLFASVSRAKTLQNTVAMLTAHTMRNLHGGNHRVAL